MNNSQDDVLEKSQRENKVMENKAEKDVICSDDGNVSSSAELQTAKEAELRMECWKLQRRLERESNHREVLQRKLARLRSQYENDVKLSQSDLSNKVRDAAKFYDDMGISLSTVCQLKAPLVSLARSLPQLIDAVCEAEKSLRMIITPEDFFPYVYKTMDDAFINWEAENPKIKARGEIKEGNEENYYCSETLRGLPKIEREVVFGVSKYQPKSYRGRISISYWGHLNRLRKGYETEYFLGVYIGQLYHLDDCGEGENIYFAIDRKVYFEDRYAGTCGDDPWCNVDGGHDLRELRADKILCTSQPEYNGGFDGHRIAEYLGIDEEI